MANILWYEGGIRGVGIVKNERKIKKTQKLMSDAKKLNSDSDSVISFLQ